MSGLKFNNKKTEALWIGVYKESDVILCPDKDLKWIKQVWPTQSQEKWIAHCKLQGDDPIDWTAVYLSPFKCYKVIKLNKFGCSTNELWETHQW